MSSQSGEKRGTTISAVRPKLLGLVAIACGLFMVAIAIALAFGSLTAQLSVEQASRSAERAAGEVRDQLNQIESALADSRVNRLAREALAGDDGSREQLTQAIRSRVPGVLRLEVFPASLSAIEPGPYPEPGFAVLDMLMEAAEEGRARSQIHFGGTASESLSFARALPGDNGPDGFLFLSVPVSVVTTGFRNNEVGDYVALQQTTGNEPVVLRSFGSAPRSGPERAPIEGSMLEVAWHQGSGVPLMEGSHQLYLVGAGLLLMALGLLARKRGFSLPVGKLSVARGQGARAKRKKSEPEPPTARDPVGAQPVVSDPVDDATVDDAPVDTPPKRVTSKPPPGPETAVPRPPAPREPDSIPTEQARTDEDDPLELDFDELMARVDGFDDFDDQATDASSGAGPGQDQMPPGGQGGPESTLELAPLAEPEAESGAEDAESLDWILEGDEAPADAESDPETGQDQGRDPVDPDPLLEDFEMIPDEDPQPDPGPELELEPEPETRPDSDPGPEPADALDELPADEDLTHLLQPESTGPRVDAAMFRAYDIRGVVGQTLDKNVARHIGQAIGSEARERGITSIAVARDGRLSGPELLAAVSEGITRAGVNVIDVGAVPTPLLYFAAHELAAGSGVMVTGSHNPPNYNGFKIMLAGETLFGDEIKHLHHRISHEDYANGTGKIQEQSVVEQYVDRVTSDIQLERGLSVVLDCGNGIAGNIAPRLFQAIGAEVTPLYCEVDGTFPNHHPDPSAPENLEDLKLCVQNFGSDLGLAFDGDGDRLGVMTGNGQVIWTDRLMILLARDVLSRNKGAAIIHDVKCSGILGREIEAAGGRPIMWKTGHSLIKKKMKMENAPLAGEMSGHIFFGERWLGFDDALYAGARLLEILAADTRSPSEILEALPTTVATPELKVHMSEGEPHLFIEAFQESASFKNARITTIDGLRADFEDGWGLVRASNTTPVLVLRFEGNDEDALRRVKEKFRQQMLAVNPHLEMPF